MNVTKQTTFHAKIRHFQYTKRHLDYLQKTENYFRGYGPVDEIGNVRYVNCR